MRPILYFPYEIKAVLIDHITKGVSADAPGRKRRSIERQLIDYAVEWTIPLCLVANTEAALNEVEWGWRLRRDSAWRAGLTVQNAVEINPNNFTIVRGRYMGFYALRDRGDAVGRDADWHIARTDPHSYMPVRAYPEAVLRHLRKARFLDNALMDVW